ncbi:MAG: hypothetical protein JWN14_2140 [Chthonomonadales bacterium]|nr:hypothetical protein [Chthonomonadales bacterium]
MRSLLLAFAFIAFASSAALAGQSRAGTLPGHVAPGGLKSIDIPEGGRLLVGGLSKQSSTDAAFRTSLGTIRQGYFDAALNLVGVVRNKDQSVTIAPFTATFQKMPVNGMIYTLFDPSGNTRVGILFDTAQRFGKTFKPLMVRFVALNPAPAASATLKQFVAEDGTEAITIPENWQVAALSGGFLAVKGPDQASVIIRYMAYFTDPKYRAAPGTLSMPFTADPTEALNAATRLMAASNHMPPPQIRIERTVAEPKPAGTVTSAWLHGTATQGENTRRFEALVQVAPMNESGRWFVQIIQKSAPIDVFQRDLPILTTIYRSYLYNPQKMAEATLQQARLAAERNNAIVQDSMRRAAAIQADIDHSTEAFIDHISDRAVVTDGNVERRFHANTAQAIVEADPQRFHILSLNEYK